MVLRVLNLQWLLWTILPLFFCIYSVDHCTHWLQYQQGQTYAKSHSNIHAVLNVLINRLWSLRGSPDRGAVLRARDRRTDPCSLAHSNARQRALLHSHSDLKNHCWCYESKCIFATSLNAVVFWSGETTVLTCFDAEYMCLTNGIFFINHSPIQKTVEPR